MSYAKYKNLGGQKTTESFNDFAITEISSQQHKNTILASNKLCVIDVYGNFCGPCRTVAPKFAQLAKKYNKENLCALVKENVELKLTSPPDRNNKPAPPVNGVPMFMFFIDGNYIGNITGADINAVDSQISTFLSSLTN